MNEKLLERKLKKNIEKLGGICLKFHSPYHRGMPDRFVFMPGGKTYFVELKTTGERQTPLQTLNFRKLQNLGYKCFLVSCELSLGYVIETIKRGKDGI